MRGRGQRSLGHSCIDDQRTWERCPLVRCFTCQRFSRVSLSGDKYCLTRIRDLMTVPLWLWLTHSVRPMLAPSPLLTSSTTSISTKLSLPLVLSVNSDVILHDSLLTLSVVSIVTMFVPTFTFVLIACGIDSVPHVNTSPVNCVVMMRAPSASSLSISFQSSSTGSSCHVTFCSLDDSFVPSFSPVLKSTSDVHHVASDAKNERLPQCQQSHMLYGVVSTTRVLLRSLLSCIHRMFIGYLAMACHANS